MIARHSLEDVLTDFATLSGDPEARLDDFVLRFPEFENELMELAEELSLHSEGDVPECAPVDEHQATASRRSLAETENRIAARPVMQAIAADPFAGRTLKAVAAAFDCSVLFLARLRDRVVRSEELSAGFVAALARALAAPAEELAAYLALPSRIPVGASFKSNGKPEATGKQGFLEALETSELSEEQKRRLSSL
ncbi:hypothetical protein [Methylorubrum podarium]|uniref:hypothetical protein n=1 Tax=Methylorubrum podarium TaxID=200476 RepID=UPI001EE39EE8|nr:hypothetical protein [Methylorubrum podarium]GJE71722.1 hypothetical protein CHKEEEPN_3269 [Methylorubrum podarium]